MAELLHENLTRWAEETPNRVAFQCGKDSLTFWELHEQSSRLAHFLRSRGTGRGDRVAIRLPPSIESAVSVYGVLKAGAAFVPIDPHAPPSRMDEILRTGEIEHLITWHLSEADHEVLDSPQHALRTVLTLPETRPSNADSVPWSAIPENADFQPVAIDPRDPAYIIFTSGSTGTPKGIVHTHASGNSYARLSVETYHVRATDRIANLSPLHFDMSTFGYFSAVLAGATTVLVPPSYSMLPASLSSLIESERITIWYSVPFALIQMLERGVPQRRNLSSIRWILYGGEPFAPRHVHRLRDLMPNAWVSNVYGPAEVNQCTFHHIPSKKDCPALELESPIPIGKAWKETDALLIADDGCIVAGVGDGELLIHSSTMMSRYWNGCEDEPTTFFACQSDGRKFYRTGDFVRRLADGSFVFLGRIDRQVKLRGYRVELEEVEQNLAALPRVSESAVFCTEDENGKHLLAAVILDDDEGGEPIDLKSQLASRLPNYALPERFLVRSSFPRTAGGKIDRRSLAIELTNPDSDATEYREATI